MRRQLQQLPLVPALSLFGFRRAFATVRNLCPPQDGEIGVIGTGGCSLDMSRMEKSSQTEDILLSPAPYAHWTIMECLQQPEAIARSLAFGGGMWKTAQC